jgi:hypothetical protein
MLAGIRVGLASRVSAFEDRTVKRFNAEGTEVGAQRARRDRDGAVIG